MMAKYGEEEEGESGFPLRTRTPKALRNDEKKVAWRMQERRRKMKLFASGIKDKAETAERKLIFRRSIKRLRSLLQLRRKSSAGEYVRQGIFTHMVYGLGRATKEILI